MNDFIIQVKNELNGISIENVLNTKEVRRLSAKLFHQLKSKDISEVLSICENLLQQRDWALGVIAYDWAYRMKQQYNDDTFSIFESWLINYVTGWGDCDDFCTHAFGELLAQHPEYFGRIIEWTSRNEFWMRRAAAVILILPIKSSRYKDIDVFAISDKLLQDDHDLVLKGYGWMLKVYSMQEQESVIQYLIHNREKMPRVSFRYAIEKIDPKERKILLNM